MPLRHSAQYFYSVEVNKKDQLGQFKERLSERLRKARIAAGESQSSAAHKLSERIGKPVEPSRIGNYEQGIRLPDPVTVLNLSEIYRTKPSYIYGFEDAPINPEEETLLKKYRQTDERGKRAIQSLAESQPPYEVTERKSA
jgi:transcriptional regulator with XRE-family HTH domain